MPISSQTCALASTNDQDGRLPAAPASPESPASLSTRDRVASPVSSTSHCITSRSPSRCEQNRVAPIVNIAPSTTRRTIGVNPRRFRRFGRPTHPPPPTLTPILGKRKRGPDTPPSSNAATDVAPTSEADEKIACRWTDCSFEGPALYLWIHIKAVHGGYGVLHPVQDRVLCGWKGCAVEGTSLEVLIHFQVHNDEYDSEDRSPEEVVVCEREDCGVTVGRGEDFQRHLFGQHWNFPLYYGWCETCGSFVQKYDEKKANEHAAACVKRWMEADIRARSL